MKVDLYPARCNLCNGKVIYTTNDKIYGRKYGSGYCYLCTKCGAYVGTHKPRPKEALGVLANVTMRTMKQLCHEMFDSMWKTRKEREQAYEWLAHEMKLPKEECHFGYFTIEQLNQAYEILERKQNENNRNI